MDDMRIHVLINRDGWSPRERLFLTAKYDFAGAWRGLWHLSGLFQPTALAPYYLYWGIGDNEKYSTTI